MTDDLDRSLKDLADHIEPVVVLASPAETRRRGRRYKKRSRALTGVAALTAAGALAAGITVLDRSDSPTKQSVAASSVTGGSDASASSKPTSTSPRAITLHDLPPVTGVRWQEADPPGTWSGTHAENGISGAVFCLNALTANPDTTPPNARVPGDTPVERTGYSIADGDGPQAQKGVFNEVVLTLDNEQAAVDLVAAYSAVMADCEARISGSTVTRVGGPETAQLWRWDSGPGPYRGYEAFGRKGSTVVIIGYLQWPKTLYPVFTPEFVQMAIDRAAGGS